MVIIFNVYGYDDAFWMFRLQAGFKLETITFGYNSTKIVRTKKAIVRQVIINNRLNCCL